jgi:hypothetical protein
MGALFQALMQLLINDKLRIQRRNAIQKIASSELYENSIAKKLKKICKMLKTANFS